MGMSASCSNGDGQSIQHTTSNSIGNRAVSTCSMNCSNLQGSPTGYFLPRTQAAKARQAHGTWHSSARHAHDLSCSTVILVSPQSTVLITFANKLNSSHRCSMRLLGPQASCPRTGAVITAACFRAAASASGVHVYCYKLRPLACMQELLPSHIPVQRVSFKEITEPAIEQAMSAPRAVNEELTQAHIARIASDHLLRSSVSPMLWKKLLGYKSPGHASSVALRLICDRETERDTHNTATFYTATAHLSKLSGCAQVCASPLNASTTATTSRGNEQIACWVLQTWCLSPHITSPSNASTPADHCHSPRRWTSRACPKPRQGSWQHLVQAAGCWGCRS